MVSMQKEQDLLELSQHCFQNKALKHYIRMQVLWKLEYPGNW